MRVAAIDCGTNTIKLLVAELDPDAHGTPEVELVRDMRMVRLGEGVDRTGRIGDAALERVLAAVEEYAAIIAEHSVPPERVRFCATSAARDADNAEAFSDGVAQRLGVRPEVLAGEEEARLSYAGATRSLAAGLEAPYLVLDIGGGSTELILGTADGEVLEAHSLDIGSVRLTERHLAQDPPTEEQVEAAVADIDLALDSCRVDPGDAAAVIGVAGTITTTAAMVLDLDHYDRTILHHSVIGTAAVQGALSQLLTMSVEQRRELPFMHPGRADVISAGVLILDRVLRRSRVASLLVSEADILDGIAWSLVE
ncbi:hydrolase [Marmoricola endophyticus]|uniref:Hydrolase n=1 Tax=Marmoricola endophyticus TaxID=2040280 RepID=A0A917BGE0_9ACTN|nr:Ppx/GppA phosphatase family protein [Marmoricola endophyticus]GGF42153.1 hydrolase [Marmoricola endophyticus]